MDQPQTKEGSLVTTQVSPYHNQSKRVSPRLLLFLQRSALVPISAYLANSNVPHSKMKLLEVAAGTGRFHTFIKDNYPDLPSICSDLSPFYLQQARKAMQEWKGVRQPSRWVLCLCLLHIHPSGLGFACMHLCMAVNSACLIH